MQFVWNLSTNDWKLETIPSILFPCAAIMMASSSLKLGNFMGIFGADNGALEVGINAMVNVTIETLTPIWTGDPDGRPDQDVFATSIIGGLRWWMEALLRGVGARIEDPTEAHAIYDPELENDGLDPVCRMFGATGWRRRFRLSIEPAADSTRALRTQSIQERVPGNHKSWYFRHKPLGGQFQIRLLPFSSDPTDVMCIHELLHLVAKWGAVGARAQMGFGVVKVVTSAKPGLVHLPKLLLANTPLPKEASPDRGLPALQNMFFSAIQPRGGEFGETTTFAIKQDLRNLLREHAAYRHFVFGEIRGSHRMGSKVFVSRPYEVGGRREIRVWGWLPRIVDPELRGQREGAIAGIHEYLNTYHSLVRWREFGSPRDSKQTTGPIAFLQSLW